jgi:hypothetical protein
LNFETLIIIIDRAKTRPHAPATRKTAPIQNEYPPRDFPGSLFSNTHVAQRVDFPFLDRHAENGAKDPLSDAYFAAIHRNPERQEQTLRTIDKGLAQHEKDQVMALLEDLQGHDWLKLMGVSGITDSKEKDFEQARTYFIKGCEIILDKDDCPLTEASFLKGKRCSLS